MSLIFLIFAAALVCLSYRSFRGGIDYLRYFERAAESEQPDFTPFVTIFAPCRGHDPGLVENLRAVVSQDYPAFEVIFVVDNVDDPAVAVISNLLNENVKMVVAPVAVDSGQKVENLRAAVLEADPRSKVFAFVDSDVRPRAAWLRTLVGPLADPAVGAATGYRWFISSDPSFASELRSSWNASIASALGPRTASNFCWGGSMAVSRQKFVDLGIRDKWKGTLSDDFTVTRIMQAAKLPIVFVPGALTVSESDCTFNQMLEFTTRQMKITRAYARHLWINSLLGSAIFTGVMLSAFGTLVSTDNLFLRIAAALTLALVTVFSVGKAWLRVRAVSLVLPEYRPALSRQRIAQLTLWLLTPFVFLHNSIAALISRRIVWRGIVYELKSPTETVIISD